MSGLPCITATISTTTTVRVNVGKPHLLSEERHGLKIHIVRAAGIKGKTADFKRPDEAALTEDTFGQMVHLITG